jgi:hypothetical protein
MGRQLALPIFLLAVTLGVAEASAQDKGWAECASADDRALKACSITSALMRHMRTPGLEIEAMLKRVRVDVIAATKGRQTPWSNSSLLGELYLAGAR